MSSHATSWIAPPPSSLWRSDDTNLADFRVHLRAEHFEPAIEAIRRSMTTPLEELISSETVLGPLASPLNALSEELRHGSGFRIVAGFPVADLSVDEAERLFWIIGRHLGEPVSQSVMGERLGHVRDVTQTDPNARAYRNKSELTPHTDPADLLAFLCLHPAARGGISRFVSSMTIAEQIRSTRPDLFERLATGYRYHRLGEQQPGLPDITGHRIPVFSAFEGFTSCRYVRQYIEVAAAEDPTITLDALDREAFDFLETLAADPTLHHEFTLASGEAVFANNFTVLHARGAFENEPDKPARHLLRLWLSTDPKRPVTPTIQHYEDEPGIQPIPDRTPSYRTDVTVQ